MMDTNNRFFEERVTEPDWDLIDAVSLRLLSKGVGVFDTLHETLHTVTLSRISALQSELTMERLEKLFCLAQFHIEYLLKSQEQLIETVHRLESENEQLKLNKKTKDKKEQRFESSSHMITKLDQLYQCASCDKVFVSSQFLTEHIHRKHLMGSSSSSTTSSNTSIWR